MIVSNPLAKVAMDCLLVASLYKVCAGIGGEDVNEDSAQRLKSFSTNKTGAHCLASRAASMASAMS